MTSWKIVTVVLVALAAPGAVEAAEIVHTVAPGDSVSAIAMRYFGDTDRAAVLLRYNGREGSVIHPGETLRVPHAVVHRVRPGDAGSVLAKRYLGRPSSWPQVAELNGLDPRGPLAVGQQVTFPAVLPHVLERGESLAALAERHYGDPARGKLLQAFNRIDDPRALSIGQTVEIPVFDLRLVDRSPETVVTRAAPAPTLTPVVAEVRDEPKTRAVPAVPPARDDPPAVARTPPWFPPAIQETERAFADGEFDRADAALAGLLARADDLPTDPDRARLWRIAAFVHVAFERSEEACAAFDALRVAEPEAAFDPVEVSPKIRDRLAGCATGGPSDRER